MKPTRGSRVVLMLACMTIFVPRRVAIGFDVVLNAQGEYLDAYLGGSIRAFRTA